MVGDCIAVKTGACSGAHYCTMTISHSGTGTKSTVLVLDLYALVQVLVLIVLVLWHFGTLVAWKIGN